MKITDIQIERYGVWQHLALPLQSAGLNVFYGPNESGKTTLMRFIRDVLYGNASLRLEPSRHRRDDKSWNGALRLTHEQRFCEVRRHLENDGTKSFEFQELDPTLAWNAEPDWALEITEDFDETLRKGDSAEHALKEILADTHAKLFRNVFAIGLHELQELAMLEEQEVSEQIYGLSLGLEGRRLLNICKRFDPAHENVEEKVAVKNRIARLMKRDEEIQRELNQLADQRERYEELCKAGDRVQIPEWEKRRSELKQQILGHETLLRVWEPWNQVREYEAQLQALPQTSAHTGIDSSRLSRLESEIKELTRQRKTVLVDINRLRKELKSQSQDQSQQHLITELQGFLNQRSWVVQLEREVQLSSDRARELKTEFEARQKALGTHWPVHRLNAADTSQATYTRLVDAARSYQSAESRQNSLRKRYDKHAAVCQKRQTELDQLIESLPEKSLEEALKITRQQSAQVEQLSLLKHREHDLEQRIAGSQHNLTRQRTHSQVPHWVPGFLLFLAISGLVLSALGFYTGLTSNGVTGAILGLVGIAGFAIARAFQDHFGEDRPQRDHSREHNEIANQQHALNEVRAGIKRNTPRAWVIQVSDAELSKDRAETVYATKLSERITELKQIESRSRKLQSRRRRLSRMRKAMQDRQRGVSQARQHWCDLLKQCGFEESTSVDAAFKLWQDLSDAKEHMRAWDAAKDTASEAHKRYETFCHRLSDFGKRTGHVHLDYNQPVHVLDVMQKDLASLGKETGNQQKLRQELRESKREANRIKKQIINSRAARTAMLAQVGATNREEFESRLTTGNRRHEIQELLRLAKAELAMASKASSDLAITEHDLLTFNARQSQESIELMTMELDDLQNQIARDGENTNGAVKERTVLENDRRSVVLRFEREGINSQLRECVEELAAFELAAHTVQQIRGDFERSCQPEILEIASDYLSQLTCGKYIKIWTNLGEQQLRLTDDNQNTVSVEHLSNGTKEQLFLALRLGLVSEFANRGIELPMVLDDVLVNFDQYRTEAAIQTLIEFAERGHQVLLFTSHLHLARLCETQGIDPVWLPAHRTLVEHRRAG